MTDFSRKEKAITSSQKNVYSCIYITKKLNGRSNTKQTKSFIFIVVPEQNVIKCYRNRVVESEKNVVIIIIILVIVTMLQMIMKITK